MKIASPLLPLLLALPLAKAQLRDEVQFQWSSAKLPFPLSDMMANYYSEDDQGVIFLTGGCNAERGNERINFDGEDLFACLSTSNVTLRFDPHRADSAFTNLAPMPHARQRHAATILKGELYLLGGRDSNDDLVTAIDVYNPQTNTWTTRGYLPEDVCTSDLTAWTWGNYIYVAGGFVADYTAVGTTYRFPAMADTTTVVWDFDAQVEILTPSPHPRGDMHAVTLFGYAYLAGGITHTNEWCEGLVTAERYHMETDTWQDLPPLSIGRADMAVAVLNNKIISIGGETKPEDCLEQSDPAYGSFPEDHVEVLLNPNDPQNAAWVPFAKFADKRFRFAAAVVPEQNRIYTFGGQLPFDFTCDCFPTSDDIAIGTETFVEEPDDDEAGLSTGAIAAIVLGSLMGVVLASLICCKLAQVQNKQTVEAKSMSEFQQNKQGDME